MFLWGDTMREWYVINFHRVDWNLLLKVKFDRILYTSKVTRVFSC